MPHPFLPKNKVNPNIIYPKSVLTKEGGGDNNLTRTLQK